MHPPKELIRQPHPRMRLSPMHPPKQLIRQPHPRLRLPAMPPPEQLVRCTSRCTGMLLYCLTRSRRSRCQPTCSSSEPPQAGSGPPQANPCGDSFLPSSSAHANSSYKAVQVLSVPPTLCVLAPLLQASEIASAHMAPKGIIILEGQQGPQSRRQLWGWLRLLLHGLGQNA